MELGVGKVLFPSWAASVTLVKEHGTSAVSHASAAVRAGDGASRLDHAVRAMTSFDHAIDNTSRLPVQWLVRKAPAYFRGYEIAKQAVVLLVGSGLIPGAKERVGRQTLEAARETFMAGVDASRTERGRYGRHLAGGWLAATAEDAVTAVQMLESGDAGRTLLAGINQVRAAVKRGTQLDDRLVRDVTVAFDNAGRQLALLEQQAAAKGAPTTRIDGSAYAKAGELLGQVEGIARELVADADRAARELPQQVAS